LGRRSSEGGDSFVYLRDNLVSEKPPKKKMVRPCVEKGEERGDSKGTNAHFFGLHEGQRRFGRWGKGDSDNLSIRGRVNYVP